MNNMKKTPHRGYLMLLAIVYGTVFLTVLGGLTMFVLSSNRLQTHNASSAEAFSLAEAGLEYYRWFLAHYPDDIQNGTGQPGPYEITYNDPEAGVAGTVSLSVTGNQSCGEVTSVDIEATGAPESAPSVTRTLSARYSRPSVGAYSYILNDSVWAGADRVILGPYHSNGGIRMDGTSNSPVTSSVDTWNCTTNYGCNPANASADGVVGSGPNQNLWSWEEPQVDFGAISADFGTLKTLAQAEGVYYPRYSSGTNQNSVNYWRGYHIQFNADDTMTVRRVSNLTNLTVTPVNSADDTDDWVLISGSSAYETRALPSDCGLIFVEDHVWIEGTIPSKVTLVAANVVNAGVEPNAYLLNNILYENTDGTDGLTVVAERNVLISPSAPNTMTLNGIFIAQGGAFGINAYSNCTYGPKTGTLTILGTTVSSKRTGTKWSSFCGAYNRGFQIRVDSFDRHMANDPPPFTPLVSEDYEFIDWREE
jgi:hypothetical protein